MTSENQLIITHRLVPSQLFWKPYSTSVTELNNFGCPPRITNAFIDNGIETIAEVLVSICTGWATRRFGFGYKTRATIFNSLNEYSDYTEYLIKKNGLKPRDYAANEVVESFMNNVFGSITSEHKLNLH